MQPRFLSANGLQFGLLEAGPQDGELVLCAHGFPDTAWSFSPLLEHLGRAGYRAVAPFMRGYLPTAVPSNGDYRVTTLARDLIALIDELGAAQAVLVGHDWGAVAAYVAAAMRPDRLRGVSCAAIPHLRRFLLRPSAAQLLRSRYMWQFQWPGAERHLARNEFAALRQLAQTWSPTAELSETLAPVQSGFSDRSRLTAALGYYRAMPGVMVSREVWQLALQPTPVPAQVLFGADDGCVGAEMFHNQAHLFAAGLRQTCFEGAGHFMHVEQPERFAAEVLDFLSGLAPAASRGSAG